MTGSWNAPRFAVALIAVVIVSAGCAASASEGPSETTLAGIQSPTRGPSAGVKPSPSAAATGGDLTGLFDVGGGRRLWLSCTGSGEPTVVYLHGLGGPSQNAGRIPAGIAPTTRICVYDRANVGKSDPLPGTHTALDSADDLHALLAVADIPTPVVLLAASFGGLVAIDEAGAHPDDVAGIVLLDAVLPNDNDTNGLIKDPAEEHAWEFGDDTNPEGAIESTSIKASVALAAKIRDIPITYLEAKQIELPKSASPVAFTAGVFKGREAFLAPYPQRRLVKVDSPHYMEPVIPDQIVAETLRVVAAVRDLGVAVSPAPS